MSTRDRSDERRSALTHTEIESSGIALYTILYTALPSADDGRRTSHQTAHDHNGKTISRQKTPLCHFHCSFFAQETRGSKELASELDVPVVCSTETRLGDVSVNLRRLGLQTQGYQVLKCARPMQPQKNTQMVRGLQLSSYCYKGVLGLLLPPTASSMNSHLAAGKVFLKSLTNWCWPTGNCLWQRHREHSR